jgi:type II secretory pathway pseudopilin PulG
MTQTSPPRACLRARPGVSLIEIMVAMSMLAIVLVTIAGLTLSVARTGRSNDLATRRSAVLQQQAARLGAIPYTTLQTMSSGTSTITVGGVSYTRRLSLTQGSNRITVKVVIAPTSDYTKTDSLVFDHAYSASSPLCSGC